jgi:hypothetical protein
MGRRKIVEYSNVFNKLVENEFDLPGFIAYGYYKLEKRDQIKIFKKNYKREPSPAELKNIVNIFATERHLDHYKEKATQILNTAMTIIPNMIPKDGVIDNLIDEDVNNDLEILSIINNKTEDNMSSKDVANWVPRYLKPLFGVVFVIGIIALIYFKVYNQADLQNKVEQCETVYIHGKIDTKDVNKIKSVSLEKYTYGEDNSIVSGKFEIAIKEELPNELTLIVTFHDNRTEKISFTPNIYKVSDKCVLDIGVQKKI